MRPQTVSETFFKVVPVECRRNDRLDDLSIADTCFWLCILYEGGLRLDIGGQTVEATGPCFICLDERLAPRIIRKRGVRCDSVYFDPTYLNINMTFDRVHSEDWPDIATRHDLFLLAPFTDQHAWVFPLFGESLDHVERTLEGMERELTHQRDWYWSCRSRSYFMELLLILERSYGFVARRENLIPCLQVENGYLQKALLYIENHYAESISLADISEAAAINHTTLTRLFKEELSMTPVEYVWHYRLKVAMKQLEFTSLPIKDVAARCGFKTVQHFCRKFESQVGHTPAEFRDLRYRQRVESF